LKTALNNVGFVAALVEAWLLCAFVQLVAIVRRLHRLFIAAAIMAMTIASTARGLQRGVYDVPGTYANARNMRYQESWSWWTGDPAGWVAQSLQYAAKRSRGPVVTIEPWFTTLDAIAAGQADAQIDFYANLFRSFDRPVIVRFAHEMESNPAYPWSEQAPATYIAAFRHFVDVVRAQAPKVRFMWSPVGDPGCDAYFPGEGYVDIVGVSLYTFVGEEFPNVFSPKYNRVARYGKPVFIAEFGVNGASPAHWIDAMLSTAENFPLLQAAILFNAQDSMAWGPGGTKPNWEISPTIW
jgi:endoglucanase